jgi:hypothetical protein
MALMSPCAIRPRSAINPAVGFPRGSAAAPETIAPRAFTSPRAGTSGRGG